MFSNNLERGATADLNIIPHDSFIFARTANTESRNRRISEAKERGQLLIFSPTLTNPARGLPPSPPPEPEEANDTVNEDIIDELIPNDSKKNMKTSWVDRENINETSPEKQEDSDSDELMEEAEDDALSPTDMEVTIDHDTETSQLSATLTNENGPARDDNATISGDMLSSLNENMKLLLEKNDNPMALALISEKDRQIKETQQKSETLSVQNAKLEARIERFELDFKNLQSKSSSEKESLIAEKEKLQADLEASAQATDSRLNDLEVMNQKLESRCADIQAEKSKLETQRDQLIEDLTRSQAAVAEGKDIVKQLKDQQSKEAMMISEETSHLQETNNDLTKEMNELTAKNNELSSAIARYEEKIDMLENNLLPESKAQLEDVLKELKRFKANESKVNSQIESYEQMVQDLKAELQDARQEKDEERQNFEALNQGSGEALSKLDRDIKDRDQLVRELKERIKELEASLDDASNNLSASSIEMESLKSSMKNKMTEMENSLASARAGVNQLVSEKKELEQKLSVALKQIEEAAEQKKEFALTIQKNSEEKDQMYNTNESMMQRIRHLEEQLQTTKQERDDARLRLETSDDREEDLFEKLQDSHRVRRELHNRVMQLTGNIRVYVRIRPTIPGEKDLSAESAAPARRQGKNKRKHAEIEPLFKFPGMGSSGAGGESPLLGADDPTKNLLEITEPEKDRGGLSKRQKTWRFGFDHVFNPSHNQEDIWDATQPLVQSAVDGFNVTLFAYGQTGSGKTFTMLGEEGQEGIISRAVQKLFDAKREVEGLSRGDSKVKLSVELLEVYNEQVRDLLVPNTGLEGKELNLKVSANEAIGNVHVPVSNLGEVLKILNVAQKRRCVKATASNAVSSRSHMLFTMHFMVESSKSGTTRSGKLNVCDLAGSERLGKSQANTHVGVSCFSVLN